MGVNTNGFVLPFFTHEPFFLQIYPCFDIVSGQSFIQCIKLSSLSLTQWKTMLGCMTSFTLERQIPCYGVVYELNPTFFDFIDDFLRYVFYVGANELEGWLWSFFFSTLGEVSFGVISLHISTTHGFSYKFSLTSSSSNSLS